jgi:hypothetical protein
MNATSTATDNRLQWKQPSHWRREFELKSSAHDTVAQIHFHGVCGTSAVARFGGSEWLLKRTGLLHQTVMVYRDRSTVPYATFQPRWSGSGTLNTAAGESWKWRCSRFLRCEWAFQDEAGRDVLNMRARGLVSRSADIAFDPVLTSAQSLLLAVVGWYLMTLSANDAAVVTVAAG